MPKLNYPDIVPPDDDDGTFYSAYSAGVAYDEAHRVIFPGGYDSFADARERAGKISAALKLAGETGFKAFVGYRGSRPPGFPSNGVELPSRKAGSLSTERNT